MQKRVRIQQRGYQSLRERNRDIAYCRLDLGKCRYIKSNKERYALSPLQIFNIFYWNPVCAIGRPSDSDLCREVKSVGKFSFKGKIPFKSPSVKERSLSKRLQLLKEACSFISDARVVDGIASMAALPLRPFLKVLE